MFGGGQRCPPKIAQCHWSGKSRPSSCSCWTAVQSLWVSYAVISFCLRKNFQCNFYLLQNLSTMGNAYSTVAGGFTNVTVHFPTLAGGVGGLFVVVAINFFFFSSVKSVSGPMYSTARFKFGLHISNSHGPTKGGGVRGLSSQGLLKVNIFFLLPSLNPP